MAFHEMTRHFWYFPVTFHALASRESCIKTSNENRSFLQFKFIKVTILCK